MGFKILIYNNRILARRIKLRTRNIGLQVPGMGLNPTMDKDFSFCNFRLFRAPGRSTCPIKMTPSMIFSNGYRCIERGSFEMAAYF